jgi:lipopolysaccharide transport system ATP-binding protein
MALIALDKVCKSFLADNRPTLFSIFSKKEKRTLVLRDISFEVESGELLGVIGRNGVGKSTLLRLIGGIYEKDSGTLITRGDIVSIFEMGSFFSEELTGAQYTRDYLTFRGLKGAALNRTVESIREFTELGEFFTEPVKTYSSGMQAKLLFGVATALPARIILIDEMLVVGDEYFQGKAWKRLQEFLAQGATGIIVSHDWISIMKLCRRTMILSREGIEFLGDTYQAVQKYLKIPFVESREITFLNKEALLSGLIDAQSGVPFSFCYEVGVGAEFAGDAFCTSFSIERHIEGLGWSLVMTGSTNVPVQGRTTLPVTLVIEDFCLAPGDYLLCLFLSTPVDQQSRVVTKGYESLTWLNGNPIRLVVQGKNSSSALLEKRLQWNTVHQ